MAIKRLLGLLVILCAVPLIGCARFAFYTNKNLEGPETGVKFYYPKPYLLVARTGNQDKPVEISVIYLPDLSKPIYAKPVTGYGSADLSLAFQNGILTNIGQKTDTKIPETISALSGLAQSIAAREKGMLRPPEQPPPTFELYEIDNSSGTTILRKVSF